MTMIMNVSRRGLLRGAVASGLILGLHVEHASNCAGRGTVLAV